MICVIFQVVHTTARGPNATLSGAIDYMVHEIYTVTAQITVTIVTSVDPLRTPDILMAGIVVPFDHQQPATT